MHHLLKLRRVRLTHSYPRCEYTSLCIAYVNRCVSMTVYLYKHFYRSCNRHPTYITCMLLLCHFDVNKTGGRSIKDAYASAYDLCESKPEQKPQKLRVSCNGFSGFAFFYLTEFLNSSYKGKFESRVFLVVHLKLIRHYRFIGRFGYTYTND